MEQFPLGAEEHQMMIHKEFIKSMINTGVQCQEFGAMLA